MNKEIIEEIRIINERLRKIERALEEYKPSNSKTFCNHCFKSFDNINYYYCITPDCPHKSIGNT